MNIDTSIILNPNTKNATGIKFSDPDFLESAFHKHLNNAFESFTEGPTIDINISSLETGLRIDSITTTYSFAPGISTSDTLSKIQNSNTINNLYKPESSLGDKNKIDKDSITITIDKGEINTTKPGNSIDSMYLDLSPSKVDYKNPTSDTFDITKPKPSKEEIFKIIDKIAPKYNIEPKLIKAIIETESSFNNQCISHSGAVGLMQLMPVTAKEMGLIINNKIDERWDPEKNIEAGIKYISKYHKVISNHFGKENWDLTLAAYNAGPNRVIQSGGIPNIKETQNYVKKVKSALKKYNNIQ